MAHIPYGYKIENGKAVVDEAMARQVAGMFGAYIGGAGLKAAAESVGLYMTHSVIGKMLRNEKYLGTDFYPAIIDRAMFDAAEEERMKRAKALGRIYEYPKAASIKDKKYTYHLGSVQQKYDNPFRQAEYAYSLIESEEADG